MQQVNRARGCIRRDLRQFGWVSPPVGPSNSTVIHEYQSQHTLWANFRNYNVWTVGSGTDGPDSDELGGAVDLKSVRVEAELRPDIILNLYDNYPSNWPFHVDYVLYVCRRSDTFNGLPQILHTFDTYGGASVNATWSKPLLDPRSMPESMILDWGTATVEPASVVAREAVVEFPVYAMVMTEGSGTLNLVNIPEYDVQDVRREFTHTVEKIVLRRDFSDNPVHLPPTAQIRMAWRIHAEDDNTALPSYPLIDGAAAYHAGALRVRGIIDVEYYTS